MGIIRKRKVRRKRKASTSDGSSAFSGKKIEVAEVRSKKIHSKYYDLGNFTDTNFYSEDIVDPRKVRILEQGEMRPLIWDVTDEHAVDANCMFDIPRAYHLRDVCHNLLRLWQGEKEGHPAILEEDWQWPCFSRAFGWVIGNVMYKRWIRRFKDIDIWISKKNKKSSTAAMIGIYLWRYDGEPGQQMYSTAKDGNQAMRIHEHVIGIRANSPTLKAETKLNKMTSELSYEPKQAKFKLLHGDNYKSAEGLNGSYMMDEVHVVPQRLAEVLADMGASRVEPLNLHVSTAGNNPNTFGRRLYEKDKKIVEGEIKDISTMVKIYEAPQNISDEKLHDPEIWKIANPSWGYTIDPVRFEERFNQVRANRREFGAFKQRRLGIWQSSAAPWVYDEWMRCYDPKLRLSDFRGRGGGIGLDVSIRQDLTAIVLCAEGDDGKEMFWAEFWLTEEQFDNTKDIIDWEEMQAEGHLNIVPGAAINGEVTWKPRFQELINLTGATVILADDTYCVQFLEEIKEAFNVDVVAVKQTNNDFAAMTEDFEQAVVAKKVRQPGNTCLDWQFQICLIKKIGDKKRPIKAEDHEKVDGVQAAIMAKEANKIAGSTSCIYNNDEFKINSV